MYKFEIEYLVDGSQKDQGFVCGKNLKEAIDNIAECYDENDIIKISLEYISDMNFVIMPNDCDINKIRSANIF